jgi:DNA polymerase-1
MLLAHTIYPELPKGLDFLNSIYTDLPYYKDEGKKFDPRIHSVERLLKYNARDALCTWQIWKCQQDDAEALKVKHFYFENVHPTFFIYKRMDQYGIRVDDTRRKTLLEKYLPKQSEVNTTINMIAEETVNPLSPAQVGKLVYDILKCPRKTHITPSGKTSYSTDEDTLENLYVDPTIDSGRKTILRYIIVARKLAKVIQFLRSPVSADGRMRTSYKLHGTETGRTSAGKSIEPHYIIDKKGKIQEIESGGSFQTIGKHGYEFGPERIGADLRSIFVSSPGYAFVEGDQGQAEDRIVCVLAEDWDGLAILNKKEFRRNQFGLKDDRHTLTAMMVLGKPFERITDDDRQNRGKKPRHAGNYNASPAMLALFTHLPYGECRKIMDRFHGENPKIRGVFHESI